MAARRTRQTIALPQASSGAAMNQRSATGSESNDEIVDDFLWDIASLNTHLEDIRRGWARLLGVSGPQWLILMAVDDSNSGAGVSVGDVSEKLHVQPTFVTAQSKILERSGYLRREGSVNDGRIVLMSLTDKARREIAKLSSQRKALNEFIFADLSIRSLRDITEKLALVRNRAKMAASRLENES
jgi:DNA-binding MarR family transcriptional regulator